MSAAGIAVRARDDEGVGSIGCLPAGAPGLRHRSGKPAANEHDDNMEPDEGENPAPRP
jgi:hypothetical protein